jgi:hypothetical protein
MNASILRAAPSVEVNAPADQAFCPGLMHAIEPEPPSTRPASFSHTLDLSAARAHDAVLDILGVYKLTGNFHINLKIVLKDLGAFDKVTYAIEPETPLPFRLDCRHVAFRPNPGVSMDTFSDIMRAMTGRIGFDAKLSWWDRLFR